MVVRVEMGEMVDLALVEVEGVQEVGKRIPVSTSSSDLGHGGRTGKTEAMVHILLLQEMALPWVARLLC